MEKEPSIDVQGMNPKALKIFLRSVKKLGIDVVYHKKRYTDLLKKYRELLWNKENAPDAFQLQQNRAKFNSLNTWIERITFIIRTENRLLTSTEVTNILQRYVKIYDCFLDPWAAVSQNLHMAIRYGLLKKKKIRGKRGHYYGLPTFFEEGGQLKEIYQDILNENL